MIEAASVLEDALKLATVGLMPCFPCLPDKRPACPHGFKNASKDPEQLKALWQRYPGALVGVPTGEPSGIFVLDIDSAKHPQADDWLEQQAPYMPETRIHRTRSGGVHLLFKHQPGLRNTTSKLARGVDTRGEGGFVIWWPFHLGLSAGHNLISPAEVPQWLVQALQPPPPPRSPISIARTAFGDVAPAMSRIQGIVAAVAQAREGERNAITFWGACRINEMVADRELDHSSQAQALAALEEAARRSGLPTFEIRRTIASATKAHP
jgi:hypothetical protein